MFGPSCDADTLEWYGASYAQRDLQEAVREMTTPKATSRMFSRRCYTSCYDSGSWQHLNEDTVSLLSFLAEVQAIQVPTMYSLLLQPCKYMLCPSGSALDRFAVRCCPSKLWLALCSQSNVDRPRNMNTAFLQFRAL